MFINERHGQRKSFISTYSTIKLTLILNSSKLQGFYTNTLLSKRLKTEKQTRSGGIGARLVSHALTKYKEEEAHSIMAGIQGE